MVSAEVVQKLLGAIESLRRSAADKGAGNALLSVVGRDIDAALNEFPKDAQGKFAPEEWAKLPDDVQASLHNRLEQQMAALQAAASDGPADKKSIMYKDYASNVSILGLTVLGIAGTVAVLWLVYARWPFATMSTLEGAPVEPLEANVLGMIVLMGALGGFIHLTSSLAKFVGNRQLLRSWVIYYLLMPVEGASLALIIYLLLRVGVLAPAAPGNSPTASLNFVGMYAFAGLAGLFSKQAVEMLADVFTTIFKKVQARDAIEEDHDGNNKTSKQS